MTPKQNALNKYKGNLNKKINNFKKGRHPAEDRPYSQMSDTEKSIHTGAMKNFEQTHPGIYNQMRKKERGF